MNRVILIGRLAKDPELRFTANGKAVANFRLAVNRIFSRDAEADFFNIVVWGKTAENCANYLAKGRLVGLEGRIQNRTYETQAGEKRYITEIVAENVKFLDWGSKGKQTAPARKDDDFESVDIDINEFQAMDEDEEIPF
ncbi:MAG: single-stranded DNA-binding protein [Candidatus Alkaliphilus sp. MAG34]